MDTPFQQSHEKLKGAERSPTLQKGVAHAPPCIQLLPVNIFLSLHSLWIKQEIIDTNH